MGRGEKDMNPVFLKIGLALAFSIGGMLCTFINRRIKPLQPPSDPSKYADCDDHGISQRSSNSEHRTFDPLATDKHNSLSVQDSFLLPEFNDLVKEFDSTTIKTSPDLPISDANSPPKVNPMVKTDSQEQQIKNLENMVKMLKERERNLEVQLLEYYGLKEQQTAVTELQSRLKLNNLEAKVFALKIESLEADNKILTSQMVDYNKVLMDLEAAHAKIDVLKKKLRSESAQNKERILGLQQRVEKLQEDELKLSKLKDLEDEVCELRKSNHDLQVEKSELTRRLEHVQVLATSVSKDQETEKLKKESEHLKKQNEELAKEIEELQANRCSDVEELVYMRWVNACLRYELRNYLPGPSKTMARDLSKSLSPRSEEKAKKLILKYANQEPDSDQWSMGSSELDEHFIDHSSSRKTNSKFFEKFVKLIRGKDRKTPKHRHHSQCSHSRNSSFEDMNSYSDYNSSKHSMDSRILVHRHSDLGIHNRIDSIDEGDDINDGFSGSPYSSDDQISELMKYAEVLKDSNMKRMTGYRRRSKSFSSF